MTFFDIHRQHFDRFLFFTVHQLEHHTWFGDCQLVAFAAHVFQQYGQVQLAAPRHLVDAFFIGVDHAQRHIGLQLACKPVAQLATGHELAFAPGQRRSIDAKIHGQCRLIDHQHGQGRGVQRVGQRDADTDLLDTADQHDVTRTSFSGGNPFQPFELQDLLHPGLAGLAIRAFHHQHFLVGADGALADAAHADAADIGRIVDRADLQLQRCRRVAFVGGDMA